MKPICNTNQSAFFFTIAFAFFPFFSLAQITKDSIYEKHSLAERRSLFPFNVASEIKLVSFGIKNRPKERRKQNDYKIPLENDTVNMQMMDGIASINQLEIDTLTDILQNTCFRDTLIIYSSNMCWLPRNAIVFFNKNGSPFAYIEICLQCMHLNPSVRMTLEKPCDDTWKLLTTFFKSKGIKTSAVELMKQRQNN